MKNEQLHNRNKIEKDKISVSDTIGQLKSNISKLIRLGIFGGTTILTLFGGSTPLEGSVGNQESPISNEFNPNQTPVNLKPMKKSNNQDNDDHKISTKSSCINAGEIMSCISEIQEKIFEGSQSEKIRNMQQYTKTLNFLRGIDPSKIRLIREFMGSNFNLTDLLNGIGVSESGGYPKVKHSSVLISGLMGNSVITAKSHGIGDNLSYSEIKRRLQNPQVSLQQSILDIAFIVERLSLSDIISDNPYRDILFSYKTGAGNTIAIYKIFEAMQRGEDRFYYKKGKGKAISLRGLQGFKTKMERFHPGITKSMNTDLFYLISTGLMSKNKTSEAISHYIRIMSIYYEQQNLNELAKDNSFRKFLDFSKKIEGHENAINNLFVAKK